MQREGQQILADAPALFPAIHGKTPDAEHWRRIARQFQVGRQSLRRHLSDTDRHKPDDIDAIVGQRHIGRTEAPALLLAGLTVQKVVERGVTTIEPVAAVPAIQPFDP